MYSLSVDVARVEGHSNEAEAGMASVATRPSPDQNRPSSQSLGLPAIPASWHRAASPRTPLDAIRTGVCRFWQPQIEVAAWHGIGEDDGDLLWQATAVTSRQAAMIGYIDSFWFYTFTALAVLPLVLLVRWKRSR